MTPIQRAAMFKRERDQLAQDVIRIAHLAGMPDTYWLTDSRIARACKALNITPEYARDVASYGGKP